MATQLRLEAVRIYRQADCAPSATLVMHQHTETPLHTWIAYPGVSQHGQEHYQFWLVLFSACTRVIQLLQGREEGPSDSSCSLAGIGLKHIIPGASV
jgi:hypothetical protein